jgi:hypothetical protein
VFCRYVGDENLADIVTVAQYTPLCCKRNTVNNAKKRGKIHICKAIDSISKNLTIA